MNAEHENKNIPFPDKIIGWFDIARGVGEVILHAATDQFRHLTPSEHFTKPLGRYDVFDLEPQINHQLGYDSEGNYHEAGL
jgi:hypothetical protein